MIKFLTSLKKSIDSFIIFILILSSPALSAKSLNDQYKYENMDLTVALPAGSKYLEDDFVGTINKKTQTRTGFYFFEMPGDIKFNITIHSAKFAGTLTQDLRLAITWTMSGLQESLGLQNIPADNILYRSIEPININGKSFLTYTNYETDKTIVLYALALHKDFYKQFFFVFLIPRSITKPDSQMIRRALESVTVK